MVAAARVVMWDSLVGGGRDLLPVAVEMGCSLGCCRKAVEPLRGMRRSAGP